MLYYYCLNSLEDLFFRVKCFVVTACYNSMKDPISIGDFLEAWFRKE